MGRLLLMFGRGGGVGDVVVLDVEYWKEDGYTYAMLWDLLAPSC
jgi:hypothetical protein